MAAIASRNSGSPAAACSGGTGLRQAGRRSLDDVTGVGSRARRHQSRSPVPSRLHALPWLDGECGGLGDGADSAGDTFGHDALFARDSRRHEAIACIAGDKAQIPKTKVIRRARGPDRPYGAVTSTPRSSLRPSPPRRTFGSAPPRWRQRRSSICSRRATTRHVAPPPTVQFTVAARATAYTRCSRCPTATRSLGTGGSTLFWDAACFSLIERRASICPSASSRPSSPRPSKRHRFDAPQISTRRQARP